MAVIPKYENEKLRLDLYGKRWAMFVDFISLRSDYDTTDRTRDSDILTEVAAEGGTPDRGGGGCA